MQKKEKIISHIASVFCLHNHLNSKLKINLFENILGKQIKFIPFIYSLRVKAAFAQSDFATRNKNSYRYLE